jgi:hypothetical protein
MTTQGLYQSVGGVWQPLYNPTNATLGISTGSPGAQGQTGTAYTLPLTATQGTPLAGGGYNWSILEQIAVSGTANVFTISDNGTTAAALTCADTTNVSTTLVWIQCSDAAGVQVQKAILIPIAAPATATATPTFAPAGGTYGIPQTVTISCSTPSSMIYYTTNGSTPTTASAVYSAPITVGTSQTVQAIATAPGFLQSAVGSAAYVINTVLNPIAVNVPSSGGTNAGSNYFEGLPIFKDRIPESAGFATTASGYNPCTLNPSTGWPTEDFQVQLWAYAGGFSPPSWTQGNFTCGVIANSSTGPSGVNIAVTGGGTITNRVNGNGSTTYTTFDIAYTTGNTIGFEVTNTTGSADRPCFAFIPLYPGTAPISKTSPSAFTNEAIAYYRQFFAVRNMEGSGALTNSTVNTSSTRATAVNKQACFRSAVTLEGQPAEWTAALAMTCGVGMWLNAPAVEDSGFTWAQSLATWLNANVPTGIPIFIEPGDELWNGYSARYNIIGIALGASTVITFNYAGSSNPFAVSNVVGFAGITGTTQLNTQFGTVTAIGGSVGAWTITVNINSTGYSPFTSGGIVTNSAIQNLGGASASNNAFVASGFPNYSTYYANMMHGLAAALRAVFGGRYGTDVRLVQAWQTMGNGVFFHSEVYSYYQTQGWNFASDIYCLSGAPYIRALSSSEDITGSMSATGVLTVTAGTGVTPGASLPSSQFGSGITISAQLSTAATSLPLIGGLGTYQTNYSGTASGSQPITLTFNYSSTVSQINSALSAISVNQPFYSMMESINAQSLTFTGHAAAPYECGWALNAESSSMTNAGAAVMSSGMIAVMNTYSQALINSGLQPQCLFQGGIDSNDNPATVALAPIDWMSTTYPIVAATCPRLASAASFITGASPTRNLVSGGTATINGANWADNPSFNDVLGNFSDNGFGTTQGPFYGVAGYRTYIVNCTAPGSYPLVLNVTTTNAGLTTNLWVNAVEVATAVALPASTTGNVSFGNVTLQEGANCIVFGKGAAQSGVTINSFSFP